MIIDDIWGSYMGSDNTLEALVGSGLGTAAMFVIGATNPILYAGASFLGAAIGYKYGGTPKH